MRITTQMLDRSFEKAGLQPQRKSLLDYINEGSSGNSLLDVMNTGSSFDSAYNRKNYEKLEKAANELTESMEVFSSSEEKESIFEKIKNGGDAEELYTAIEEFAKSYNDTMSALKRSTSTMDGYYHQMMQSAAGDHKKAFEAIGISIEKDGTLKLDKEKLKEADPEVVEKVFGSSGSFIDKTAFLAERIADNAKANRESIYSQYSASGSSYTEQLSKYDVRG